MSILKSYLEESEKVRDGRRRSTLEKVVRAMKGSVRHNKLSNAAKSGKAKLSKEENLFGKTASDKANERRAGLRGLYDKLEKKNERRSNKYDDYIIKVGKRKAAEAGLVAGAVGATAAGVVGKKIYDKLKKKKTFTDKLKAKVKSIKKKLK